ncbi:MAG: hypothetical protein ACRDRD_23280 [Pseudonocardiaceae bacterium]
MDWPYTDRPEAICWSLVAGRWWRVDAGTEPRMRASWLLRCDAAAGLVNPWNVWARSAPGARFEVSVSPSRTRAHRYEPPAVPS